MVEDREQLQKDLKQMVKDGVISVDNKGEMRLTKKGMKMYCYFC